MRKNFIDDRARGEVLEPLRREHSEELVGLGFVPVVQPELRVLDGAAVPVHGPVAQFEHVLLLVELAAPLAPCTPADLEGLRVSWDEHGSFRDMSATCLKASTF